MIDEAGMADTLALDAAVQFVIERGGSVRLVGDDQQLAAIGAGGVLRDIRAQHGALQLSASWCGSVTRPKAPHRSRYATATPKHWASTSTANGSTWATWPP